MFWFKVVRLGYFDSDTHILIYIYLYERVRFICNYVIDIRLDTTVQIYKQIRERSLISIIALTKTYNINIYCWVNFLSRKKVLYYFIIIKPISTSVLNILVYNYNKMCYIYTTKMWAQIFKLLYVVVRKFLVLNYASLLSYSFVVYSTSTIHTCVIIDLK